ncbi:DMT family transporter [Azospirillum sp. TSA6c]|uniref:DMT family transporter n=1 Tax=Azospirillum sp. TSA6c TaxID=709813 RepID=UPI000D6448B1|nr:DMT family transporter [Azospirillum sp. TSA6c]
MLPTSVQAALWALASAITFSASSAAAKFLGTKLSTAELAFFRAAAGGVVLVMVWRLIADLGKAKDPVGYLLRCGLGVLALYCFMYALGAAPLALVFLIFLTRALMLPVAARLMLGEPSGPVVWVAVIIGFIGAAIPLVPALREPEQAMGILAAMVAAVATAGSQTAVRRLTEAGNAPAMVVLVYSAASVLGTLPAALPGWVTPPAADWPVLTALGLFGVAAQYTAAKAFNRATVGFLAPLDFLAVPAAAGLGWLLFGEVPSMLTAVGAIIVLLAAIIVVTGSAPKGSASQPQAAERP